MRRRVATAGGVAILPLLVIAAHAKKPTVDCPGGRFLVQGRQLVAGTGTGPDDVMIDRASRVVSIGSGCPAVAAAVVPTPKGTRIHAVWPLGACTGLKGRAQLKARILPGCRLLSGTLVARKLRKPFKDIPLSTGCGDGLVDPGLGETCDGATGCGAGEHCVGCDVCAPGAVASPTTTTLPTTVTTRCCQATGACFDAGPADAQATCAALHNDAMLAPAGQVCNGVTGLCGNEKRVGANCCQCLASSPPFPHPQYCFDTNITSCGSICTKTVGVACGSNTETCGRP